MGSDFLEIFLVLTVLNQLLRQKGTSVRHYSTCNQCLFKKRPKVGSKLIPGIYVRIQEARRVKTCPHPVAYKTGLLSKHCQSDI